MKQDWPLTIIMTALITIGSFFIYSTTFNAASITNGQGAIEKHIILISIGIIAYLVVLKVDFTWLREPKILAALLIFTISILIFTKFGTPGIANTNRWIRIGPITIQPSEYSKIIVILITSACLMFYGKQNQKYFIRENIFDFEKLGKTGTIIKSNSYLTRAFISLILISPIIFFILIQPALGNSLIVLLIWFSMFIIAFPDKIHLFGLILIFIFSSLCGYLFLNFHIANLILLFSLVIGSIIIYKFTKPKLLETLLIIFLGVSLVPGFTYAWNNILKDYQKTRIETFLNPLSDPQGAGWQVQQSQIAIGSGRIFGKGFMEGTQSNLHILPYAYTDFIFAAIAEQIGFVGTTALLILILALPARIFILGESLNDKYEKIIIYAIGSMFLIHIFINIGMNLGKLPVTGVPLPFISYGGSSIIMNMISIALVQNILNKNYSSSILKM